MAGTENVAGECSRRVKSAKYARYTEQQIEVLEQVYAECSNPNGSQREKILREQPCLNGINSKQLKIWFQNRRFREKQKKENDELVAENKKLAVANRLLREENDNLQKKLTSRPSTTITATTTDAGLAAGTSSPQLSIRIADNNSLLSLAEETRNEFLSKAIGTAIKWNPILTLKLPNLNSIGAIYVSDTGSGVAARACTTTSFDPLKTIDILKNRPSWSRDCRKMDVLAVYPASNGGAIELIYTQYYAPTTKACARDFWTLRYTSVLDDGSLVVCEKSVSASDTVPSSPAALEFVRGRMMASGCLIQPCERGSAINLVSHFDLEASYIPEMIRPLYESSELMAKKMIVSALHYIEHVASEKNFKKVHAYDEDPAFVRTFSQRVSRGFNDAINGFIEDGWTLMNAESPGDVIVSIKQHKNQEENANHHSVICVKSSFLLQNMLPTRLVMLLKERRSSWMNFNFSEQSAAFSKAASVFPGVNTHNLSENVALLGHTNNGDEILEVNRFDRVGPHLRNSSSEDLYHLQICSGMGDTGYEACSELIFAPIDRNLPDDAALLSSGFRIFLLSSNTGSRSSANTPSAEACSTSNLVAALSYPCSLLILAFQFPCETYLKDDVASMALKYVQHVISSVKNISLEAISSGLNRAMNPTEANSAAGAVNLANLIFQSYRSNLGVEMPGFNPQSNTSTVELIQHHPYAILCFSFSSPPVCLYANQAGLNMLETTTNNLLSLTADKILSGSNNVSFSSILPTIMQQGYTILPSAFFISEMSRCVSYEQGVVWRVQGPEGSIHGLAFALVNWSFM